MWRKLIGGVVVLSMVGFLAQAQEIKNPDTLIRVVFGDLESLDPAWHYDTASATAIFNVYETLIFYQREKIDVFEPALATEVPSLENGLIWVEDGTMYIKFPIRRGVYFHYVGVQEGDQIVWKDYDTLTEEEKARIVPGHGELTPEDVAYSFQRALLQDRSGGPVWMLLEPILGVSAIDELAKEVGDLEAALRVKEAIVADEENWTVTFRLAEPFGAFLQIIAGSWGSILDREWVIAQGGWDGSPETWRDWHDPAAEESELFDKANGTGPFKLEHWIPGEEQSFLRNEHYWKGPARLKRGVIKVVDEWSTRLAMFQAQDVDSVVVPRAYIGQVEPLLKEEYVGGEEAPEALTIKDPEGIAKCFKDLPGVAAADIFFNFKVADGSPFMPLLGGEPKPDLFSDIHLRRAFNYAFDWERSINEIYMGEAIQRRGPIIAGMFGFNPEQPVYSFDLEAAATELKQAWGGELWEKGFRVTVLYNTGNLMREAAAGMIKFNVESLNAQRPGKPPFRVEVQDLPWPTYLKNMVAEMMPVFIIGWLEDYHDPHNWVQPYMHRVGAFAGNQNFGIITDVEFIPVHATWLEAKTYPSLQDLFDDLIEMGRKELNPEQRELLYYELQHLANEWAIDIFWAQPTERWYFLTWVHGWYYNPAYPGIYFYPLWKG